MTIKKNIIVASMAFSVIILPQYSGSCLEFKTTYFDAQYKLAEKFISQDKWEEATAILTHLTDLMKESNVSDGLSSLKLLEARVSNLVTIHIRQLYIQGQHKLKNSEFNEALKIFRKILYYDYRYSNARKLAEQARILRNISTLTSDNQIKQIPIVVTSQTLDKRITGLRIYKPDKCFNGYTLFTHQSLDSTFHLRYIYLIDMNGNMIYRWVIKENGILLEIHNYKLKKYPPLRIPE